MPFLIAKRASGRAIFQNESGVLDDTHLPTGVESAAWAAGLTPASRQKKHPAPESSHMI
jgi:hypothetical protein